MKKRVAATVAALLGWGPTALAAQEGPILQSAQHDFRVTTVAEGLVNPFSMTFTPEGDLLVAERPGRLRIIQRTGDVVWEIDLPAGTSGAPMTYLADGRQFIVVAIGDRHTRGRLVALALRRR